MRRRDDNFVLAGGDRHIALMGAPLSEMRTFANDMNERLPALFDGSGSPVLPSTTSPSLGGCDRYIALNGCAYDMRERRLTRSCLMALVRTLSCQRFPMFLGECDSTACFLDPNAVVVMP